MSVKRGSLFYWTFTNFFSLNIKRVF